jgi:hypothetical protein
VFSQSESCLHKACSHLPHPFNNPGYTNPQSLQGMHLPKEDDTCVLAYTETITERNAYYIPVVLVVKFL